MAIQLAWSTYKELVISYPLQIQDRATLNLLLVQVVAVVVVVVDAIALSGKPVTRLRL